MNAGESGVSRMGEVPWVARINVGVLVAVWAAFAAFMWPAWRSDDNLAHGAFLPVLSGILLFECRRDRHASFLKAGSGSLAACLFLVAAALFSLLTSVLYAAALGWSHAMAEFMLAAALVSVLLAAWIGLCDRRVRLLPFNWAAAVAIGLWIFASPPPPGTYARVAYLLQTRVTEGVVGVLGAVGIAAYRDGNVIELARTSVGVSEACSGVRSLISCTVAGLFLSALLVRGPWRRVLVVLVSPIVGLGMNFLRSLLLTLLANAGISIEGRWHDLTGASILAVTTLLVAGFAFWLRRGEASPEPAASDAVPDALRPTAALWGVSSGLLAAGLAAWFVGAHLQAPVGPEATAPDLAALLPPPPPGWTAQSTPHLDQFSDTLKTRSLVERIYLSGPSGDNTQITLYLAYWAPGEAPVSLVDAHTPDACWPGTGWQVEPLPDEQAALDVGGRTLFPAQCRLFSRNGYQTHVWFWHLYGGQPLDFVDPYSARRLLGLTLRYGFRRPADQLFVRVSSNRTWQEIASRPAVLQFFKGLKPLGL